MTDQERTQSILAELEYGYIGYGNMHEDDDHGCKVIGSALKKSVPMKPEKCTIRAYNRVFGRCVEEKTFTCSVCGHFVRSGWNYCKNCGSAIDWSEE